MTFVVFALPRSRTFWLSKYLSYADWYCGHDEIKHARTLADVASWFQTIHVGTVETAGAAWWRLLKQYAPDARIATVRRPRDEVVASLMATGFPFDRQRVEYVMRKLDQKLDQIEQRMPNVLRVSFDSLKHEQSCAALFEHCLPFEHSREWWEKFNAINLQDNLLHTLRYMHAYAAQHQTLEKVAKHATLAKMLGTSKPLDGITIQQEPFDAFFADAARMLENHMTTVGEAPDTFLSKNLNLMRLLDQQGTLVTTTARASNGTMLGYLLALMSPSFESSNIMTAQHLAFYAEPSARGAGLKLQRSSVEALRQRGVSELYLRAGVRGEGPRLDVLYRRMGAHAFGETYKLELA